MMEIDSNPITKPSKKGTILFILPEGTAHTAVMHAMPCFFSQLGGSCRPRCGKAKKREKAPAGTKPTAPT